MAQLDTPMLDPRLNEHLADREFGTLASWCVNNGCAISWREWLGGGNTQAQLAAVLIDDGHSKRKVVLKYCPSPDGIPSDHRAFQRASESGPAGFSQEHLVRLDSAADKPITNGSDGLFLLMEWRTGGRDRYDTMATLLASEVLGDACKEIVGSTLLNWNDVRHSVGGRNIDLPAVDFLREILGDRCQPGGSIAVAAERLGAPPSDAYLQGSKEGLLPNPIAAATTGQWINGSSLVGLRGNAHGDLHADNILIPRPRDGKFSAEHFKHYVLIDLSTFGDQRLLAVDPAHLLLSIVARRLINVTDGSRHQLARLVLEPEYEESGGTLVELASAARGIQQAGLMYCKRNRLYDEWRDESILAIAGCALLFVGRPLPDKDRRWFLELAGMAIDAFCKIRTPSGHSIGQGGGPPPDAMPPGQARSDDATPPRHDPVRATSLTPVPGAVPGPRQTSGLTVNQVPLVIEEGAAACNALLNELAAEILGLTPNMSAHAAFEYLFTARDIVGDLLQAIDNIRTWNRESGDRRQITYLTAIEIVATNMNRVTEILDQIGEHGTRGATRSDASAAIAQLRNAIRELTGSADP
jgi:hypothetical protein